MNEPIIGTTVGSPLVNPGAATHYSTSGAGGYQEVPSLFRLHQIPLSDPPQLHYDGQGSGRRRIGMKVVVTEGEPETWVTYRLQVPGYESLDIQQRLEALADNANWQPVSSDGGPAIDLSTVGQLNQPNTWSKTNTFVDRNSDTGLIEARINVTGQTIHFGQAEPAPATDGGGLGDFGGIGSPPAAALEYEWLIGRYGDNLAIGPYHPDGENATGKPVLLLPATDLQTGRSAVTVETMKTYVAEFGGGGPVEPDPEPNNGQPAIETTVGELFYLRDTGQLTPGQAYTLTDYRHVEVAHYGENVVSINAQQATAAQILAGFDYGTDPITIRAVTTTVLSTRAEVNDGEGTFLTLELAQSFIQIRDNAGPVTLTSVAGYDHTFQLSAEQLALLATLPDLNNVRVAIYNPSYFNYEQLGILASDLSAGTVTVGYYGPAQGLDNAQFPPRLNIEAVAPSFGVATFCRNPARNTEAWFDFRKKLTLRYKVNILGTDYFAGNQPNEFDYALPFLQAAAVYDPAGSYDVQRAFPEAYGYNIILGPGVQDIRITNLGFGDGSITIKGQVYGLTLNQPQNGLTLDIASISNTAFLGYTGGTITGATVGTVYFTAPVVSVNFKNFTASVVKPQMEQVDFFGDVSGVYINSDFWAISKIYSVLLNKEITTQFYGSNYFGVSKELPAMLDQVDGLQTSGNLVAMPANVSKVLGLFANGLKLPKASWTQSPSIGLYGTVQPITITFVDPIADNTALEAIVSVFD